MPMLIMTCVKAPKRPFSFGGAISEMYMGTTTIAAPAPTPDITRPKLRSPMLLAELSNAGPMTRKSEINRMVISLPYLLQHGPEAKAPSSPPRVYIEDTTAN